MNNTVHRPCYGQKCAQAESFGDKRCCLSWQTRKRKKNRVAETFIDCATTIRENTARDCTGGETCAQARTIGLDEGTVPSARGFLEKGFALSGDCAGNNFHSQQNEPYRCVAVSVEGFIQQLSTAYISKGYKFFVAGSVPLGVEERQVDEKLISKYQIRKSKYARFRQKKRGEANIQYLRFGTFFLLLATHGRHRFFQEETNIRDVRRHPIRFGGYSVGFMRGRDGKWHASVRIDSVEFRFLKQRFVNMALTGSFEFLVTQFRGLPFVPYAPVRDQYFGLLRAVNRKRQMAGLEKLPVEVLPLRRKPVRPFG